MQRLRRLWHSLFWPNRRSPMQDDSQIAGGRFGKREVVLPRGHLLYKRFDLSEMPPARRAQALALKLEAWQPLAKARFWHGWHAGIAHAWSWAEDDPACVARDDETAIPESALHQPLHRRRAIGARQRWVRGPDLARWPASSFEMVGAFADAIRMDALFACGGSAADRNPRTG